MARANEGVPQGGGGLAEAPAEASVAIEALLTYGSCRPPRLARRVI
jgi:hypothetical protein